MTKRVHPFFPTIQEVKNDPNLAYSDHLTILTHVPLGQGKNPLTMISLNMLGDSQCSGIHEHTQEHEPKDKIKERHQRLFEGLAKAVNEQQADVLFLQEAYHHYEKDLQTLLGDKWKIIADEFGILTCYRKTRLEEDKSYEQDVDSFKRRRGIRVKDTQTGLTLALHNIWDKYVYFPDQHEKRYRELLNKPGSDVAIIFGDTNSRLAPLDDHPRNIITGIIPTELNEEAGFSKTAQRGDHPDGGFYRDASGIHQLQTKVLPFQSGELLVDLSSTEECQPPSEFRMIMCLDDSYNQSKEINDQTLFDYERQLQQQLGKPDILVRMASDTFNHKAIAICFPRYTVGKQSLPSNDFTFIHNALKDTSSQFQTINARGKDFDCVFVPFDKVDKLHLAIEDISRQEQIQKNKNEACQAINRRIAELGEWRQRFMRDPSGKIASLKRLSQQIDESKIGSLEGVRIIVEQWEKEKSTVDGQAVENKTLMNTHRNYFFAPHPESRTKSTDLLQSIKKL